MTLSKLPFAKTVEDSVTLPPAENVCLHVVLMKELISETAAVQISNDLLLAI